MEVPRRWVAWGLLLAAGGVWGLGAARTLAFEASCAACFGIAGAAGGFLLGAAAAALMGWALERAGRDIRTDLPRFASLFLPLIDVLGGEYVAWRGPVLLVGSLLVTAIGFMRASQWACLALSMLVPLAVYLPDVSPYVGRADTFEFQVIGPQLGIAHPSGYPLYTLLAKLFSLLPVGTVAWRINLTSIVFASMTAGLVYLMLSRGPRPLALLSALMLAFSPTLWSRAIEAEVYALNAFLTAAVLCVVVAWTNGTLKLRQAWPALGLLIGLALASHITLGALGAIALGGLVAARQKPQRREWLIAAGLGCLGLLLYVYIPLRWPAVTGGERLSLTAFVRYVTNAGSGGALLPMAFLRDPGRWLAVGRLLVGQVGWVGLALAAVGLAAFGYAHLPVALGTVAAFGAWVWFNLSFYVAEPDYSAFLVPAVVVLVFWMGCGVQWVGRGIADYAERSTDCAERRGDDAERRRRIGWRGGAWVALVGGLVLGQVWRTGPWLDTISVGRADELWARYVLSLPLEEGAAILADSEKFPPLYYLQQVGGLRPDLELVTLFSEAQYREALGLRLAAGQPVYLARYLPGVDGYGVSSAGPLVAVAPAALSRTADGVGVRFGEDLRLVAHRLEADHVGRGMHHLTLTWRADDSVADDLDVRLRLVELGNDSVVWETNEGRPVSGYTTTRAWRAGWVVDDYHVLSWPSWVPGGVYRLYLQLAPHFEAEGLPVDGGSNTWYALGEVTVQEGGAGQGRMAVLLDPKLWLVGAQYPGEVAAGAPIELDLTWICMDSDSEERADGVQLELSWVPVDGGAEARVSPLVARGEDGVTLMCADGRRVRSISGTGAAFPAPKGFLEALGAQNRTDRSAQGPRKALGRGELDGDPHGGAVVRRYVLEAPGSPGRYRLEVGWPEGQGSRAAARCSWLGPRQQACSIGTLIVTPSVVGEASFDGRILLVLSSFDTAGVTAGGPMKVALTSRAVQTLDKDYTVFVQVVGPDGQLYGQVDSWPGQGARPTSGWAVGEEVVDAYEFYVDADRPAGEYRVIVGWYLLADMTRLPVVDSSGVAIGDFAEIGAFALP